MRIIQVCQLYYPAIYGGGELLFFETAKELVRQGHEVIVITQRLKGCKDIESINGIKIYRTGKAIDYKGHLSMSLINNASFLTGAIKLGLKLCRKADIIHSNTYAPSISAQITSHILKIPHVMTVHDVYSGKNFWNEWSNQKGVGKLLNFLGPLIELFVLKLRPNLIHTVSNTSKNDLLKARVRAPIQVVPCAINLKDYQIKPVRPKNQFCYVGRHVFYKNVDTVIRAMPAVLINNPSLKFIIIGDGPMKREWQALARKLGVSGNVIFKGRVSNEEKLKIINESLFLTLPSTVEGFGIVLLEAWALKKPVIASNTPPLNEVVTKDYGTLVEPYNTKAWTQAIQNTLNKEWNITYPEKYTIQDTTKKIEKIMKKLIH